MNTAENHTSAASVHANIKIQSSILTHNAEGKLDEVWDSTKYPK